MVSKLWEEVDLCVIERDALSWFDCLTSRWNSVRMRERRTQPDHVPQIWDQRCEWEEMMTAVAL